MRVRLKHSLFASILGLLCTTLAASAQEAEPRSYDVVVVGATPGGIAAAIAAARAGCTVGMYEPSAHIGGIIVGGLTATDYGDRRTIGGLSREFFQRVLDYYRGKYGSGSAEVRACNQGYWFEPHVAQQVFREFIDSTGRIQVFTQHPLIEVSVEGRRIRRVRFRDDVAGVDFWVAGDMFVDALYEGDLLALAGEQYRVGREGSYEANEPHAGAGPGEPEAAGTGDLRIQAYNYRLCLTDNPDNRVPISQPEGYRREDYLTAEAFVKASEQNTFARHCVSMVPMPFAKTDTNNGTAWQSTDWPGANHDYYASVYDARKQIAQAHRRYILGLLYFLQNDPAVPERIRTEASAWGLAKDEFVDNGNWPYALYVRESRRLVGQHILTEQDVTTDNQKADSIGLGSYAIDSHFVRTLPQPDGTWRGAGWLFVPIRPYEIPYGVVVPQTLQNLLVPVCCSATHVGYCTLRMEPVYMILGHACGEAAAMAREKRVAVQDVDVPELQRRLTAAGQLLRVNRRPVADFRVMAEQPLQAGTAIRFEDASTDEDGEIVERRWDLDGDGAIDSTEQNPTFTYTFSREYEITLRVRDDYGDAGLPAKRVVTVTGGPPGVPDLLIDDDAAERTGEWFPSTSGTPFVGDAYRHDGDRRKGQSSARYAFEVRTAGTYEVAVGYTANPNRATNVPIRIRYAAGEVTVTLNQRTAPETPPLQTVGKYAFAPGAPAVVEIGNAGTEGYVVIDAVRLRYVGP
ncbi:MAG: FAD-dependent oxidoreductase [Armatimonadetes bacterium]|nr:FAD-dependent oxidoreductase [Armatimonadota bacterium]